MLEKIVGADSIFARLTHMKNMGFSQKEVEIMNKYESIIIINIGVEEKGIKALIKKFSDLINKNGKVESVEELGKRRLAYEIKKSKEGYYVIFNFESKPSAISELERNYKITDEIIKFIVIRKED